MNASISRHSNVTWVPGIRGSGQPLTSLLELTGMLDTCDSLNSGFVLWFVACNQCFANNTDVLFFGRYSNIILGSANVDTSYALSQRFGGSCSFDSPITSQSNVSPTVAILGCAAVALAAAVGCVFLWTRFGPSSSDEICPKARQETFIRRNLIIVAVAEILMTIPQAGIPLLFSTRIQRIMCAERQLPCAQSSIAPSDSVIGATNLYTSYLSSALGASNFLGTLLVGSVSDVVGRRSCILVVSLGLVADSLTCLLCSDLQVCLRAALCHCIGALMIF
jgi:hypothetical protein